MSDQLTITQQDAILKWLHSVEAGTFTVTPEQATKIKRVWSTLHWLDTKHEYTLSEDMTKLKKELR